MVKQGGNGMTNSYDDFTLHALEMRVKDLIRDNEHLQGVIKDRINVDNHIVEWLIFENRILVLYEVLKEIKLMEGDKYE